MDTAVRNLCQPDRLVVNVATFPLNGIPPAVSSGIAPGHYVDDQLVPVYDALLEGLEDWLNRTVTSLHRRDAVLAAADHVAACLAPLQQAYTADATEFANLGPVLTTPISGARFLLEEIIAYADGGFPVSRKKLTELHAAASDLVVLSNCKTSRITGAQRLSLTVDGDRRITMTSEAAAFDLQAYERAYSRKGSTRREPKTLSRWLRDDGESVGDHPWRAADAAMRNEYGCSLRTFMRTMVALVKYSLPARKQLAVVKEASLADEIVGDFRISDVTEVHQAILALTADRDGIRKNLRAWQQREREARLTTTPLFDPARSGRLVIVPALVFFALKVHMDYLLAGTWPGPEGERRYMTPFRQALKEVESHLNLAFEREVAARFEHFGFTTQTQVKALPGVALKGDIDVLAVHAQRRQIWIVEVKDPITPNSPAQFASQVRNFKEWSSKHLARVAAIDSSAGKVATRQLFRLPDVEAFVVRSIIVTRNPSPVSFWTGMPERIIWLKALPSVLNEQA